MANPLVGRILDRAIEATTLMGGVAVVLMMLHITIDILLRYFASPPPGTMSIVSYYYMLVVSFVSLAFAERRNAHISVEILYELFPRSLQNVCRIVGLVVCLAVFGLMTMKSWDIALDKFAIQAKFIQGNSVVITWPGFFLLPLGFALIWLTCLLKLFGVFVEAPGLAAPVEAGIDE